MNTHRIFKVMGFVLVLVMLLAGGIGITGVAAQSAIPGDALYGVKTTIETTRLSLAQDAGDRAQMKLSFAEQRLTEIAGLIQDGRYREIREAVLAFESNINAAIRELETVAKDDPQRAALLAGEVTSALTRYAQTLSELAAIAPESVRPEVKRALDTTQIVTGLGQPLENENANSNDNGDDDNANGNSNDNDDDDNANGNSNDNGDDDNANGNSNDNDDDDNANGNSNANDDDDNVNDNSNANDDDDNANGNSNDNGDDDNANGNSNSNDDDDDDNGDDGNSNGSDDDDSGDNDNNNGDDGDDDSSGSGGGDDDNDDNDNDDSGKDD